MHPELYLTVYRQQERELEQRLLHRLRTEERRPARTPVRSTGTVTRWFAALTARPQPSGPDLACCTA